MPAKGHIEVNEPMCKGCELCVNACPQQVIILAPERINAKGYHPATLVSEGCTGCAICALVCPEAIITVFREGVKVKE